MIKKKTKEYLTDLTKVSYLFFILSFISGFLIWNLYLYRLGFSEFKIIQTRFILSGAVFVIITIILLIILCKLLPSLRGKIIKTPNYLKQNFFLTIIILIIIYFVWIYLYTIFIFPFFIPAFLGGGQPQTVSIISTEDEIDTLSKFGILKANGRSSIQTQNLCLAYENEDIVIVLLTDRILQLKKVNFKGFGSLSIEDRKEMRKGCRWISVRWVLSEKIQLILFWLLDKIICFWILIKNFVAQIT